MYMCVFNACSKIRKFLTYLNLLTYFWFNTNFQSFGLGQRIAYDFKQRCHAGSLWFGEDVWQYTLQQGRQGHLENVNLNWSLYLVDWRNVNPQLVLEKILLNANF